jgi:ABC-type branched-subunit amino acid transport system substrate-binding protein
MSIRITIIIVIAVVAIVAGGIGYLMAPSGAPEEKYITIGTSVSMNHGYCLYGLHGTTQAIYDINEAGGITVAGETYKLKWTAYDDRMLTDEAITNAKRLIEVEGIRIYQANDTSSCGLAVLGWLEDYIERTGNDVLYLTGVEGAKEIHDLYGGTLAFRTRATNVTEGSALAEFVFEKLEKERHAYLLTRDDYGFGEYEGYQSVIEELGKEPVYFAWVDPGTLDIKGELTQALAANPDILSIGHIPGEMAGYFKQAIDVGFDPKVVIFDFMGGTDNETIINAIGAEAAEGAYVHHVGSMGALVEEMNPKVLAFQDRIRNNFGEPATQGQMDAYDCLRIAAVAIEKAGTLDIPSIKEAMRSITVDEVQEVTLAELEPWEGGLVFNEEGQAKSCESIEQIKDGTLIVAYIIVA